MLVKVMYLLWVESLSFYRIYFDYTSTLKQENTCIYIFLFWCDVWECISFTLSGKLALLHNLLRLQQPTLAYSHKENDIPHKNGKSLWIILKQQLQTSLAEFIPAHNHFICACLLAWVRASVSNKRLEHFLCKLKVTLWSLVNVGADYYEIENLYI